jgi:hypothetical protein
LLAECEVDPVFFGCRRLQDECVEASRHILRIAADQNTSSVQFRSARERADELKELTRRARIEPARALSADGISEVQIAGRIWITLESVNDVLAMNG